jgi:hypothetical protein
MKRLLLILVIASAGLLVKCGTNDNNSDKKNSDSTKNQNSKVKVPKIIESKSIGQIKIGQDIDKIITTTSQKFTNKIVTNTGEEGDVYEETVFTLFESNEEMLQLTGDTEKNVDVITIISNKYKTKNGIGVGSSIDEFIKTYPDYKIYYSYISGFSWLETKIVDVQFMIDIKNFTGKEDDLMQGDLVELKRENFKKDTKIFKVRIF